MEEIPSVCPRDCYDTCGLIIRCGDRGEILSVRGDPAHPITRGLTCPRAAKDHERLHKNRIEAPHLRLGTAFRRIEWEEAFGILSQKVRWVMKKHGPEKLLYLAYAGNMGLLTELFPQRLWNALGATQTDGALCSESGHRGLSLHYGHSYGILSEDLFSTDLMVFWGFNAAVSAPHLWSLAREASRVKGVRIVVVDPIQTRTAQRADLWVRPRPGTDVALAYGVMNDLIRKDLVAHAFIRKWTLGYNTLRTEASTWTPDRVEAFTGVAWKEIESLAECYGRSRASATLIGIGLQKCEEGADQVRAVSLIPALLGRHRGFFYSNGEAFSVDNADLTGKKQAEKKSKIVQQVALADLVREGAFKCIYVSAMNPALTLPNQKAFREGITREDVFLTVHDSHWSRTAHLADLVLPAPTFLEKDDAVIPYGHPYARLAKKALEPITDSRSEVQIMQELARRLDLKNEWLFEDPWEALRRVLPEALEEGDFDSLISGNLVKLRRRSNSIYATPSGKIEFYSSQAETLGKNPLPAQRALEDREGRFVYMASAIPRYTHTQFQEVYGDIPAQVLIHPQDAERLKIKSGQRVVLSNDRSAITMEAIVSEEVLPGVLWSPRESEGLDGTPQNSLTSSAPQRIGAGPTYNSTWVTLCQE